MAKRTATSDLNHDNWDRDDAPEEAGTFSRATDDTMRKRKIKVAKRRNPIAAQSEDGKPNAFGGFSGFGKAPTPATTATFGFLTSLGGPKTNGTSEKEAETKSSGSDKNLDEYYGKLKGLNESVTEWIQKHVSENPFINLQPVFKDYDKYMSELEVIKSNASKAEKSLSTATTVSAPQFSFGPTTSAPKLSFGTTTSAPTTNFSFGATTSSLSTTATNSFSSAPTFSFGSTTSSEGGKFSFTNVVKPADPKADPEEEDDDAPKEEMTPVVEEGHIYTTKCKVYVKKDGAFGDHGVGTLYLKPVPDSPKVQLIVRAESNLGRLICNFILSESIPMQRMGKKDVMLVCVPNPDMKPPPLPILLRVKGPEEADELLKILQKHKK